MKKRKNEIKREKQFKNMKLNYKNARELTADPSKKTFFQKKDGFFFDVFGHKHVRGSLKSRFDGLEL